MGVFEMVVAVVAIGCAAGVIDQALKLAAAKKNSASDRLEAELAALRQEMASLKTWANDLILSFDSTQHEQNARLQSLERRVLGEGAAHAGLLHAASAASHDQNSRLQSLERHALADGGAPTRAFGAA